jgi:hypothetical protein
LYAREVALRDELEQALLASWNTGDLTVYADHLQSLGDPRGELIALDLAPSRDRAWQQRRRALLDAWLGPVLAASGGRLVQHGVLHELRDGHGPPGLLDSPLGAVIRGFSAQSGAYRGPPASAVLRALDRLAAHPRPWLTRLALDYCGDTLCDPALRDRLIAATPNLVELYTLGERLFDTFHHPSLRRLYATPAFQRPGSGGGVPDTHAEVLEIFHYGYATNWFARDNDLDAVLILLEAIETTSDCNDLYATYGDLAQEHDSMPAVLMRLDEAGLIQLDGPFASLTPFGRGLLRPTLRDRTPPRVPPSDSNNRKWVLWASDSDDRPPQRLLAILGLLRTHCAILVACLVRMPLDDTARHAIHAYLSFLCDVVAAGEWQNVELDVDLPTLASALRSLLAAHRLTTYHLDCFADLGDDTDWSYLQQLVELLDGSQTTSGRAWFRVAWGF